MATFFRTNVQKIFKELSMKMNLPGIVKFSHYYILCNLYYNGEMSLTELSKEVGVALPNISNGISELVVLGLVNKFNSEIDERIFIAKMTDKGIAFSKDYIPKCHKLYEIMYLDLPCEPSLVAEFLLKVSENIDAANE